MKDNIEEKEKEMREEAPVEEPKAESQDRETEESAEKEGRKSRKERKAEKASNEKVESLEKEVESLRKKVVEEKNDYLRLMAEFETFRRRTAEEKLSLVSSAASDTIKGMLPVLDDCERALEMLKDSSDESAKEGTNLIYTKLMKYLSGKGLEKIEAKGAKFDTDYHEAVAQVPVQDEDAKGKVYDVVENGYMLGGKVIRYAKVVVGI